MQVKTTLFLVLLVALLGLAGCKGSQQRAFGAAIGKALVGIPFSKQYPREAEAARIIDSLDPRDHAVIDEWWASNATAGTLWSTATNGRILHMMRRQDAELPMVLAVPMGGPQGDQTQFVAITQEPDGNGGWTAVGFQRVAPNAAEVESFDAVYDRKKQAQQGLQALDLGGQGLIAELIEWYNSGQDSRVLYADQGPILVQRQDDEKFPVVMAFSLFAAPIYLQTDFDTTFDSGRPGIIFKGGHTTDAPETLVAAYSQAKDEARAQAEAKARRAAARRAAATAKPAATAQPAKAEAEPAETKTAPAPVPNALF
jgi:hypothetical protein